MVYNIKKSNGAPLVSIPDSTQDTTTTSLILPGRNAVNFGQSIDQNFVNLLQNFANTSPPPSPQQGQLWYDSVNMDLKVYDSARWIAVMSSFDGSSGVTSMRVGTNNTGVTIVISQYQIITVISADRIQHSDCPDSIIFNDISYAFAIRFPNGIYPGINLATDPSNVVQYWMNGKSTYANALVNSRTIHINGTSVGQFKFDGTSDVNVAISDSNVYVTNAAGYSTTTTVAGTWTKVRVSDGGRILAGNNITASDVVAALGYTPYNGANANVNAVGNTIVGRDQNANFAANIIVARSIIATRFEGTAGNADTLSTSRTIFVNGDMYGNVAFDGSSNVTLTSNLVTSGVTAGTYTKVYVDDKGRVTNADYNIDPPISSIILFPETVIPDGWVICDGRAAVTGDNNTSVTVPNLTSAAASLSSGTGATLKYIMKYRTLTNNFDLTPGIPGTAPASSIGAQAALATVARPNLSGGLIHTNINGVFGNIEIGTVGSVVSNEGVRFTNTTFMDTEYFDSIAFIMGLGDTNGIMFSNDDVWKNFNSLTIQDIRDNLKQRSTENLPAFAGKYMLPVRLIDQQSVNLSIPSNIAFSPLLQDQLVSSITSNFAHQLSMANITPTDNNLFGCHYLGSAAAWISVLKSGSADTVSKVLHNKGYYTTTTSQLESYTGSQLSLILAQILQIARDEIQYRKSVGYNVIVAGQYVTLDNNNTIVTSSSVNGYRIGDNNYVDQHGGYFPDYQNIIASTIGSASISPSAAYGSAGVVTLSLADAGACALAAVLQTTNPIDQAGLAQLCVNRTGAQASGISTYGGNNGFDCATAKDVFSALSSAIYGPNANLTASAIYGGLNVNITYLKSALETVDQEQMKLNLASLFGATETTTGKLTQAQLQRIAILRNQVYTNGPEMDQAQAAIGPAVNFVAPMSEATMITSPFGIESSGYLTLTPISGYFIPNTSDATGPAPAPSPASLLNRILKNRIRRPPIEPGSMMWDVPGNYQFSVPANHTITIEAWGAGGGGGPASGAAASRGGDSSISSSAVNLIAGGGGGGNPGYYRRGFGTGGVGGSASGGTTNLDGNPGGYGEGSARGGNTPNGGTGGASATVAVGNYQGSNGNAPGGGGGAGYSRDGSKDPSYQGGGGGGSGAYVLFYSTAVGENTVLNITVGAGGVGSSTGGSGLIIVTWN